MENEWQGHFRLVSSDTRAIYLSIFFLLTAIICALPLLKINVSVRARGMIRPESERASVRAPVAGIIREVKLKEGLFVEKQDILVTIEDSALIHKTRLNEQEIHTRRQWLRDLALINSAGRDPLRVRESLSSELMASQWRQYASARE